MTKYICSSTVHKYNFEVALLLLWVLPFYATLYFYSTTFQREIFNFILHYIYFKTVGRLLVKIKILHYGYYNKLWKYSALLKIKPVVSNLLASDILQKAMCSRDPTSHQIQIFHCKLLTWFNFNQMIQYLTKNNPKTENRFVYKWFVFSAFLSH